MIFGIMGAMPDEVDQLCARLQDVTCETYAGVDYLRRHGQGQRRQHRAGTVHQVRH